MDMSERATEPVIAVIGGNRCGAEDEKLAEEVGRELARRGITLVCGGLGGVMEAACRGSARAGGRTVGILPTANREDANPYVRLAIPTGMGYARNVIVVLSSQAVIAIDGSYGTLTEIAYALQNDIPVIGLGTWSASQGGRCAEIIPADSAIEAVEKAAALIGQSCV